MRSHSWHFAQHLTFFGAGLLFWWPVVNPRRSSVRLPLSSVPLYLFLASLPCDALSAFLAFCDWVIYPSHVSAYRTFGLTALQDQECAGALMWFWVTIAYLLPAVAVTLRILSPSAREGASAGDQTLVKPVKPSTSRRAGPDASALGGPGMVRAAGHLP
jgi:putative membrane protein